MSFSESNRQQFISNSNTHIYDLIVIGGGITGAGIALDAIDRGIDVCLLEKDQFASGTSSKSTKLIHAGIRYLKQLQIDLVQNTGKERLILSKLAPNLAEPIRVLIPGYKGDQPGLNMMKLGMWVFERLVAVPKKEKFKNFTSKEFLNLSPQFNPKDLKGATSYYERLTTDSRLTIEIIKQAVKRGVKAINYIEVKQIEKERDIFLIKGIDKITGKKHSFRSRQLINASGPWLDLVRKNDHLAKGKKLILTKGIHIVIDHKKLKLKDAVYFSTPDKRMIFAIPRFDKVYIGTTDTFYKGNPDDIKVTKSDIDYVIKSLNSKITPGISVSDIEASWVGLRPLIVQKDKSASEISRKDEIFKSSSGMYSIAGGKLTGYRLMAKKILDRLYKETGLGSDRCRTNHIMIQPKGSSYTSTDFEPLQIKKLVALFGSATQEILKTAKTKLKVLTPEQALHDATYDYCLEHECLIKKQDLYTLHTNWAYFNQILLPKKL